MLSQQLCLLPISSYLLVQGKPGIMIQGCTCASKLKVMCPQSADCLLNWGTKLRSGTGLCTRLTISWLLKPSGWHTWFNWSQSMETPGLGYCSFIAGPHALGWVKTVCAVHLGSTCGFYYPWCKGSHSAGTIKSNVYRWAAYMVFWLHLRMGTSRSVRSSLILGFPGSGDVRNPYVELHMHVLKVWGAVNLR